MSQQRLEEFGAFRKANELFDFVVTDMSLLTGNAMCSLLVGQQIFSADSICANIEEGWGRGSKKDYAHFLDMSRGSARETRGRYCRLKHWLPAETVKMRVAQSSLPQSKPCVPASDFLCPVPSPIQIARSA